MKFVFIGGCGRSGTTLVQKILLSHSQITGGGEFDFLPLLLPVYSKMSSSFYLDRQVFFYNKELLKKYWQNFILQLLKGNIDDEHYTYLSEKTPSNVFVAKDILDLIPESKFIYIYRDGRDVVNSFLQVNKRSKKNSTTSIKTSLRRYALSWNMYSESYSELKNDPDYDNRHTTIQYEQLVNQPEKIISDIMNFLELPMEKEQLQPELFKGEERYITSDNVWYTQAMDKQKINKQNIGKWEKELNFFQKFVMQVLMSRRLQMYNYPVGKGYIKLNLWLRKLYYKMK